MAELKGKHNLLPSPSDEELLKDLDEVRRLLNKGKDKRKYNFVNGEEYWVRADRTVEPKFQILEEIEYEKNRKTDPRADRKDE